MVNQAPTDEVIAMRQQGVANNDIIEQLKNKGFSYEQISDALTQAEMKANVEGAPAPTPAPGDMQPSMMSSSNPPPLMEPAGPVEQPRAPPSFNPSPQPPAFMESRGIDRGTDERIEEIAESIINEKWKKMVEDVGDINVWKEKVKTNITSIKQEVIRIEGRFESLQKAVMGKVSEYDKNIGDVGAEIKALEKLLQKIIEPLTKNVNELSRITDKMKK